MLLASILVTSCTQQSDGKHPSDQSVRVDYKDSIKVGMTYDEVERLLGRPGEIDRGVAEVELVEPESQTPLEYRNQEIEFRRSVLESNEHTYKQALKTIGTSLYVTWWYSSHKIDTIRYIQPEWRRSVKNLDPRTEYYINGMMVSKKAYELTKDTVYWTSSGDVFSREDWYEWYQRDRGSMTTPEPAHKEIRIVPRSKEEFHIVADTNRQQMFSRYKVTFDAASGRVVFNGVFPYVLTDIP